MARFLTRPLASAIIVAMLLALVAVGPASAGSVKRAFGAEKYAHSLLNCTRTGGFVNKSGKCLARGSGKYSVKRPPLRRHKNISKKVAWPWARAMVTNNVCAHVIAGKPSLGQRLRNHGFKSWLFGENVGCAWGTGAAKAVVLASHRAMQAEKKYQGGHWRNIKRPSYKSVGVGVAKGGGRVMVVWDFYGKRY